MADIWTTDTAILMLSNLTLQPSNVPKKKRKCRKSKKKKVENMPPDINMAITQAIASSIHRSALLNPFLQAIERPMIQSQMQMTPPMQIVRNTTILDLSSDPGMASINKVVEYQDVQVNSSKYKQIASLFPPSLVVLKIQQIFNPFLQLSFQLMQHFKYPGVKPMELFHGTKLEYVHSICMYNFDWRFNGAEKGHKYGMGVNFTPNPKFANHFCEKEALEKVVILADVLVGNTGLGSENLEVPPPGCDTTTRDNKITFVKFSDAEFYPKYVVFFKKK